MKSYYISYYYNSSITFSGFGSITVSVDKDKITADLIKFLIKLL